MDNMVGKTQTPPQTVQVPNYSGVNIQIFNPSVAAPGANVPPSTINNMNYSTAPMSYPANYYTNNYAPTTTPAVAPIPTTQETPPTPEPVVPQPETTEKKKTEKREIIELTDDYIMNLENYLNSQEKNVRLDAAKQVLARLQEDDSRKDDPALNALLNKMLQDPYGPVKFLAMAALDSRAATGDDKTVNLLKTMQSSKKNYGEDALKASSILLKMSGSPVEKEFDVKEKTKK